MYQLNYDNMTGKVSGIRRTQDGASIPLCPDNTDYQAFLEWNAVQSVPLDLNSTKPWNPVEGKAIKLAKIRADAKVVIEFRYPAWYQANVANGIYFDAIGDAMKANIALVIAESNRCEDLVDAATTEVEVKAVTPNWPVL